jgi:hypothetical protein
MFILSYLFILGTYLLCVHLSYHISPYFSNNAILWILSLDFWFQSLLSDSKKNIGWSMPCTMKHTYPSHPNKGAINSSPEVKPRRPKKLRACLGGSPLTLLTTFSTVSVCWVVELCVCLMMLGFMTLFELVPWSECWCIVDPISAMTSVT